MHTRRMAGQGVKELCEAEPSIPFILWFSSITHIYYPFSEMSQKPFHKRNLTIEKAIKF